MHLQAENFNKAYLSFVGLMYTTDISTHFFSIRGLQRNKFGSGYRYFCRRRTEAHVYYRGNSVTPNANFWRLFL